MQKEELLLETEVLFRVYQPPNVEKLNAAFLISGHGMGSKLVEDPIIRKFADKWGIALIGFLGDPMQRGFGPVNLRFFGEFSVRF